jgi:hypothetical protein
MKKGKINKAGRDREDREDRKRQEGQNPMIPQMRWLHLFLLVSFCFLKFCHL